MTALTWIGAKLVRIPGEDIINVHIIINKSTVDW